MAGTGRRLTIEVTEEMIGAAKRELLRFDPEFVTARDGAADLLCAALNAGGFEVVLQDRLHAELSR